VEIYTLAIDDLNEEEFASHGVTPREVLQVLDGPYRVFVNEGAQNAPYVMVGLENSNRSDAGAWRLAAQNCL
jgi:hypothetical protein